MQWLECQSDLSISELDIFRSGSKTMYPFKMNFILHYLMAISNEYECVFYPTMSPARVLLCQGYEIMVFPTITESVAQELEEIYIVSTLIKCVDSNSEHFRNLRIFAENDNMFWDCDCMDDWLEGLRQPADVTSECQRDMSTTTAHSTINATKSPDDIPETTETKIPSDATTQSDDNYITETAEDTSADNSPQPDDQVPKVGAAAAAAAGGGAALLITAIIIAVRVGRRPTPSFDVEADAERFWLRQSNSSSRCCCRCLKPNARPEMPALELEDMDHFSVCESEI